MITQKIVTLDNLEYFLEKINYRISSDYVDKSYLEDKLNAIYAILEQLVSENAIINILDNTTEITNNSLVRNK
jgi:hypothetical protein